MNKKKLAYHLYNAWSKAMFGDFAQLWENLYQYERDRWIETAESIIPGIEYLQKESENVDDTSSKPKTRKRSAA